MILTVKQFKEQKNDIQSAIGYAVWAIHKLHELAEARPGDVCLYMLWDWCDYLQEELLK